MSFLPTVRRKSTFNRERAEVQKLRRGGLPFLPLSLFPAWRAALGRIAVFHKDECADTQQMVPIFPEGSVVFNGSKLAAGGEKEVWNRFIKCSGAWEDGVECCGRSLLTAETKQKFIPLIRKIQRWPFMLSAINHSSTCSLSLSLSFLPVLLFSLYTNMLSLP